MSTFDSLQREHDSLLEDLHHLQARQLAQDERQDELDAIEPDLIRRAQNFILTLGEASSQIVWTLERNQILAILRFWADFVSDKTGVYPTTLLRPADRDAVERARVRPLTVLLRERHDVRALEQSVREAEMLEAIGWLKEPDAASLLAEARHRLENKRREDAEWLVALRSDEIGRVAGARMRIEAQATEGEQFLFDSLAGTWRPIAEVLEQSNEQYERLSAAIVKNEMAAAEPLLPAHPDTAAEQLAQAVSLDIAEHHRRRLRQRLAELEPLKQAKREAEEEVAAADKTDDALEKLSRLRRAQKIFREYDGLPARIDNAHQAALDTLTATLSGQCRQAEMHLRGQEYEASLVQVEQADKLLADWPDLLLPESLVHWRNRIAALHAEACKGADSLRRFEEYRAGYQDRLRGDGPSAEALDLLRLMRDDSGIARLAEFRRFFSEVEQYVSSPEEEIGRARAARARHDWQDVIAITERLLARSQAQPAVRDEAERILAEATQEMDMGRAERLLREGRVAEAENILRHVTPGQADPERREELGQRLHAAQAEIERARSNREMQTLYEEAANVEPEAPLAAQIAARRMYRYVGGDTAAGAGQGWPPYGLSMYTVQGRDKARELTERVQTNFLDPIRRAWAEHRGGQVYRPDLDTLAQHARLLRQAEFPGIVQAWEAIQWVEVTQRSREARAWEADRYWSRAVEVWRSLLHDFPRAPEALAGLRNARLRHVLAQVQDLDPDAARRLLERECEDPVIGESWEVQMALARCRALLGDWAGAGRLLAHIERGPAAAEMAVQIRELQRTMEAAQYAERLAAEFKFRQTFVALRAARVRGDLDNAVLDSTHDRLLHTARGELVSRMNALPAGGDPRAIIDRAAAAMDLAEMEELAGTQIVYPSPSESLEAMRPALETVARDLCDTAERPDVAGRSVASARNQIDRLAPLLHSLSRFDSLLLEALRSRLAAGRERIDRLSDAVQSLESLLREAEPMWDQAAASGDLHDLENIADRMRLLGLEDLGEVQMFRRRLSAWKQWHGHLLEQIAQTVDAFHTEKFSVVMVKINEAGLPPSGIDYQDVPHYDALHKALGPRLWIDIDTENSKGNRLFGWEAVLSAAELRQNELDVWTRWHGRCQDAMARLEESLTDAENYDKRIPKPAGLATDEPSTSPTVDQGTENKPGPAAASLTAPDEDRPRGDSGEPSGGPGATSDPRQQANGEQESTPAATAAGQAQRTGAARDEHNRDGEFTVRGSEKNWDAVLEKAIVARDELEKRLTGEATACALHSAKARDLCDEGTDWKAQARNHLLKVERRKKEIETELTSPRTGMPSEGDLKGAYEKAEKDRSELPLLRTCLERAWRIGPIPGEERDRITGYQLRLQDLERRRPGLWQSLRRRIARLLARLGLAGRNKAAPK